ncbi:MAG: 1,4-dihydroxy-2-naphthoate octaprenyltransferase [Methanocella sp. PtaU1.Bin125]|nr:MAG: 1,4-dihydroxy-2-naphthoate octaprenyltransferase [Methanocella sp. PtaU1.Bin125]
MLSRMGAWVREFRLVFLLFGVLPVIIGSLVACDYYPQQFSLAYFFVSLVAIVLLHAGTIAFNDYFDYRSGADVINRERTPFTGGTGLLVDGTLKPSHVLGAGSLCFALCIALGMFIVFTRSPAVFLFGVVGVGLGSLYTAPPLRLAYRLLGEITWFLSFPMAALGALVVQAPPFSAGDVLAMQPALASAVVAAMPVAFLATAGFVVLEFPDYDADRASGKVGATVLIGKKASIFLFAAFCVLSIACLAGAVALGFLPVTALAALLLLPAMVWVGTGLARFHERPVRLVPYIVGGAIAIYLFSLVIIGSMAFK